MFPELMVVALHMLTRFQKKLHGLTQQALLHWHREIINLAYHMIQSGSNQDQTRMTQTKCYPDERILHWSGPNKSRAPDRFI